MHAHALGHHADDIINTFLLNLFYVVAVKSDAAYSALGLPEQIHNSPARILSGKGNLQICRKKSSSDNSVNLCGSHRI